MTKLPSLSSGSMTAAGALPAWAAAVLALGEREFPARLLAALAPGISADHLVIMVFDASLRARVVDTASRQPGEIAREAGRLYEKSRFYRHDPGARQLGSVGPAGPVLLRLHVTDIHDARYRHEIYDRFHLLERLSLIDRIRHRWIMLSLYRSRESGAFQPEDVGRVREFSPLLLSLAGKHVSLRSPTLDYRGEDGARPSLDAVLSEMESRLSARERAVCALALAGHTVPEIARELGVKPPTVATLRRRAYAKLGITSLNALFARCLERLALLR